MIDPLDDPTGLLGSWVFERVVDDRLAGRRLDVTGTATFTQEPSHISWVEHGTLLGQGADPVPVSQTRRLERASDGRWWVLFADGREFHPWGVGIDLEHACAPDAYRGHVDRAPEGWHVRWAATGPAKNYVIDTDYRRA